MNARLFICWCIAAALLPLLAAQAEPRAGEMVLPEVSASVDLDGRSLPIRYRMYLSKVAGDDGESITRLRSVLDLSGAFSTLVESVRGELPDQRCRRHRADNWVVKLREMSAEAEAGELLLGLVADVQMWACVDLKILGQAQTELADARVWMELPLALDAQGNRVTLHWRQPQVRADGDLARAARLYFASRGEDLSEQLARRIQRARPDATQFNLPTLLLASGGRIHSARFVNFNGMPHAEVEIDANIGIATWVSALRNMWG